MNKKIFVIVPVYKVEPYLHQCIDSILSQTYRDFELILVDDGSPDNCPVICDEYAKKDNRVTVIHKANGGLSSARNAGLDYIKNKPDGYVTFIDSDDWVDKDYLESLVDLMLNSSADIVCSAFIYNDEPNHCHRNIDKERVLMSLEATIILLRDETIQSHAWSKLYKASSWKEVRFDETIRFMEDQCTTYKLFYKSNTVFVSNYAGYHYRQDNQLSLLKTKYDNKKVISGLRGYYYPCLYKGFTKEDRDYLLPSIHNALVSAYLMLIPYYKRRNATDDEKAFMKEIKKYIKDNKLVKHYVPDGRNNSIKKRIYRMCPPLYPYFFKFLKSIK